MSTGMVKGIQEVCTLLKQMKTETKNMTNFGTSSKVKSITQRLKCNVFHYTLFYWLPIVQLLIILVLTSRVLKSKSSKRFLGKKWISRYSHTKLNNINSFLNNLYNSFNPFIIGLASGIFENPVPIRKCDF